MIRKRSKTSLATEELSKRDYETLAAFRYSLRRFFHFSEMAARHYDLTAQQHQALLAIQGFPDRSIITVGELAERLKIEHHSAVGLVNRLEEEKLISRRFSNADRRQVWISLTERGWKILGELSLVHREELRQLSPQLCQLLQQLG